jgi:WD40 repeat protein
VYESRFSPDRKKILGKVDDTAVIWDAETGKELLKIEDVGYDLLFCFSPDGKKVPGMCR